MRFNEQEGLLVLSAKSLRRVDTGGMIEVACRASVADFRRAAAASAERRAASSVEIWRAVDEAPGSATMGYALRGGGAAMLGCWGRRKALSGVEWTGLNFCTLGGWIPRLTVGALRSGWFKSPRYSLRGGFPPETSAL